MGCNYYFKPGPACLTCGHEPEHLHIGKASVGWVFALHVIPEKAISSLDDWELVIAEAFERFPHDALIYDEYHRPLTQAELLKVITDRRCSTTFDDPKCWAGYRDELHFHASNYSERGPNNLLRHRVDGRSCIGHGAGTWDLHMGEFS